MGGNRRHRRDRIVAALAALAVALGGAACAGTDPGDDRLGSTVVDPSTVDGEEAGPDGGDGSEDGPDDGAAADDGPPALDLAPDDGPLILFGAVPPLPPGSDLPLPDGSADFHDLFLPDAPWSAAVSRIGAFKLHAWQVRHVLDDDQLLAIIDWLDANDLPLMFETEPLLPPDPAECDHTESFEGPYDLEMARRIRDLGGTIAVVAIEQPFHFAHRLTGPGACEYPLERVLDEVVAYVEEMRTIFPGVPVGSIEGIWQNPPTEPEDLALWLDAWEERTGEPFAFLHLDPDWARSDWGETALGIEAVADERGVPFGILYNGNGETTNDAWLARTMDRIAHYEHELGGTPDHVALQSWTDQPDRVLPDDDLGAFTSLVNRHVGSPTDLEATVSDDGVAFRLSDTDGTPLSGRRVAVTVRPLSGGFHTHTVGGTVPDAAATAVVAVRVHVEDAEPGTDTDVRLDRVAYRDGDEDTNRIDNPDFDRGLTGWGAYGEPLGEVSVDRDPAALHLVAGEGRIIMVDSAPFPVTPGSDYEFEVRLGVPDTSIGKATVAVVFLDDIEVTRHSIPFAPAAGEPIVLPTDGDGVARFSTGDLEPGRHELEGRHPGDLDHWPSSAVLTVDVPAG